MPESLWLGVCCHIVEPFAATLRDRLEKARAGHGLTEGVGVGPLIDQDALDKMQCQVDDAVSKGATVVAGGQRLTGPDYDNGHFFAPTVLSGVTPDMLIYREETFGPIAPIVEFEDEDDVLEMANDTTYGLAAYIYTRDLSRAFRAAEALDFGIIGINDVNPTSAAVPFGGIKESGLGREGAKEGILEYLDKKVCGIAL